VDQGIPAIAFSQTGTYTAEDNGSWLAAEALLPDLLPQLAANLSPQVPVLNVNFPQISALSEHKGVKVTASGRRRGPMDIQSRPGRGADERIFHYDILREDHAAYPDGDIHYAMEGYTTVTPLAWSLTHMAGLGQVKLR
jgi:broad specificity polyphosphatase/5'/3'-nucleotidase SurE